MYYYDTPLKKKRDDNFERLTQRADSLSGRNREIAVAILSHARGQTERQVLFHILGKNRISIAEVFTDSEYGVLVALFGDELADKVKKVWDRTGDYRYSSGWQRRSYRADRYLGLYLDQAVGKLVAIIDLVAEGFAPDRYFEQYEMTYRYSYVISDFWALEIDEGNQSVKERLRDILFADTQAHDAIREVIKGLLMSHDHQAHQWVGDLLLAAKLQEGLRQAIAEQMDEGSREAFLYLYKIVLDHNLSRFSSFVRAFDVWTGLGMEAQKPQVVIKALTAGYRCLTEPRFAEKCIASDDALLIYIALWAKGVDNIQATEPWLQALRTSPSKYKRLVALGFLRQTLYSTFMHRLSVPLLDDQELEVQGWAVGNLFGSMSLHQPPTDAHIRFMEPDDGRRILFNKLDALLALAPKKGWTFEPSVFPWWSRALAPDAILRPMMLCAKPQITVDMFQRLQAARDKMEVSTRIRFVEEYVGKMPAETIRSAILSFLDDKSETVRRAAMKIAGDVSFVPGDFLHMEEMLRFKSGDLRKNVMTLLLRQPAHSLFQTVERLSRDKNENKRLAALDLIERIQQDDRLLPIRGQCQALAEAIAATSQKTRVVAEKLINPDELRYTRDNGFGLYDPKRVVRLDMGEGSGDIAGEPSAPPFLSRLASTIWATLGGNLGPNVGPLPLAPLAEVQNLMKRLDAAVDQHKDFEYRAEGYDGQYIDLVIGSYSINPLVRGNTRWHTLDDYPLAHVWRQAAADADATPLHLLTAVFLVERLEDPSWIEEILWFGALVRQLLPHHRLSNLSFLKYPRHVGVLLRGLLSECDKVPLFMLLRDMVLRVGRAVDPEKMRERLKEPDRPNGHGYIYHARSEPVYPFDFRVLNFWLHELKQSVYDDASFRLCFDTAYNIYRDSGYHSRTCLDLADFERALQLEIIDEPELYAELAGRPQSPNNLRQLTSTKPWAKTYAHCIQLKAVASRVVERVLEIELKRGDLPTEVSELAGNIERNEGACHFVGVVAASGNDPYERGYHWASASSTKKDMLSHILKNCYPVPHDNADTLRDLMKSLQISDKQLVDAAMYAPQWLGIVEAYLGWPGLATAGWYFHAHVSDFFSDEKKAMVARYSPIDAADFKEGAFDINWFREAYETIGPTRFAVVYDSAKYIGAGALHRRAQIFADAVLGKTAVDRAEAIILEKRNKEYVISFGLIPLAAGKDDVLGRYEVLQRFLKESKQFGAQRRDSEGKAVSIALGNLARNAGYVDSNRFSWSMELEKIRAVAPYLQPNAVEGVELKVSIDDLGMASLVAKAEGKALKSVPARLKKHPTVVAMQAVQKSLKDQYSRARVSLERAMESQAPFSVEELADLTEHLVIYPLLRHLVLRCGDDYGYFHEGGLRAYDGKVLPLSAKSSCTIAHPVHLFSSGSWAGFQKDLYDRGIVQPFKQVFRELYRPNADELAMNTVSLRYAGHQIQPKKAVALLRGRGWTVSPEDGLQKVYHQENLIAYIYALADWFSPAEVEAPTIEEVHFTRRKTGERVPFHEVPPVLFSETMRDIDLVVSVAHVGGVDPEASLSTVEMRQALVAEMVRLLKLKNVELKGSHAFIAGHLGEYAVHLGSGVAHKMASGALHILAVNAQHRGRLFLPFVDDDPRTAEIISKITMLADDQKIKDPNIVEQLRG